MIEHITSLRGWSTIKQKMPLKFMAPPSTGIPNALSRTPKHPTVQSTSGKQTLVSHMTSSSHLPMPDTSGTPNQSSPQPATHQSVREHRDWHQCLSTHKVCSNINFVLPTIIFVVSHSLSCFETTMSSVFATVNCVRIRLSASCTDAT